MLFSVSFPFALYWFNNEGNWYLQVNLIYSWLCEGSIYLGERIMYLSFAFEIVRYYCISILYYCIILSFMLSMPLSIYYESAVLFNIII